MENRIKVIIPDNKKIPGIGKGPINSPIYITQETYDLLVLLGIKVVKVEEETTVPEPIMPKSVKDEVETTEEVEEEEDLIEDDVTSEDIVEESNEDLIEDEEEEVVDEVETTEEETIDISSLTKKEIKERLDEMEVDYPSNANLTTLRSILEENLD